MSGGWTWDEGLILKGGVDSDDWNKSVLCSYLTELNLHNWIFKKVNGPISHVVSNARKFRIALYNFFTSQIRKIHESYRFDIPRIVLDVLTPLKHHERTHAAVSSRLGQCHCLSTALSTFILFPPRMFCAVTKITSKGRNGKRTKNVTYCLSHDRHILGDRSLRVRSALLT